MPLLLLLLLLLERKLERPQAMNQGKKNKKK